MAKFSSTVFDELRGSLGNVVASRSAQGGTVRKRAVPKNPKSAAQTAVRSAFAATSKDWRALTEDQRTAWHSLGRQMTVTDSLGGKAPLTGSQAYASLNGIVATFGGSPLSDAPGTPDSIAALPTITLVAARTGSATGAFTLAVQSAAYTGKVQVYASPAVSAGRNTFGKGAYRLLEVVDGLSAGSTSLTAAYVAKYGTPAVGTKIAVKLVAVSANGFRGGKVIAVAVVAIGT